LEANNHVNPGEGEGIRPSRRQRLVFRRGRLLGGSPVCGIKYQCNLNGLKGPPPSARAPQGSHFGTRIDGLFRPQHALCSSFKLYYPFGTSQQNLQSTAFEVIDSAPSKPTDARSSPYYLPRIFDPLQGTAWEPNFPIITNRALTNRQAPE
jgi:hypothetical protein